MIYTSTIQKFGKEFIDDLYDDLYKKLKDFSYKSFKLYCNDKSLNFDEAKLNQAFDMAWNKVFSDKERFYYISCIENKAITFDFYSFINIFNSYCSLITYE